MQIPAPPVLPQRGGYLNSPAEIVEISDDYNWTGSDVFEWQQPPCACAEEFPVCQPHVKSDSNIPARDSATSLGIESSYACSPPFSRQTLSDMAALVVDTSTEDWVARSIAAQLILNVTNTIPGPYTPTQGWAVLLQQISTAGRGIIHVSPYTLGILLGLMLVSTDAQGNLWSVIGGHSVVSNPHVPDTDLIFTGYGRVIMSTIQLVSTFDNLTNIQREGAERYLVTALNYCGSVRVIITP